MKMYQLKYNSDVLETQVGNKVTSSIDNHQ